MKPFSEVKKNFGFGCMRLPKKDGDVDIELFKQMVDYFISRGFNYFDTAHGYHRGRSETAIKEALTSRYPRDAYVLANKLSGPYFEKESDVRPFFESQLGYCGVDRFDFYLMHAQDKSNYKKFKACRAYETAFELKKEGKIGHVGLSFHDKAEVLDMILTENPDVEFVQIQFNYVDYDSPSVESGKVYETARKHGKPVIVMEPVKGGSLVNLPSEADKIFRGLGDASNASYAIRFAAGFDGMFMVLSGMSDLEMMKDNLSFMEDFKPLDNKEKEALDKVRNVFRSMGTIPCTGCSYCTEGCPVQIKIPSLFSCYNTKKMFNTWNADFYYENLTKQNNKASDCLECGACEAICPQHLEIRSLLKQVAEEFEGAGS